MAGLTGLEPAASGVTGRRSNQLNYNPMKPTASVVLGEHKSHSRNEKNEPPEGVGVGGTGLEPVTRCL